MRCCRSNLQWHSDRLNLIECKRCRFDKIGDVAVEQAYATNGCIECNSYTAVFIAGDGGDDARAARAVTVCVFICRYGCWIIVTSVDVQRCIGIL